MAARDAGASRTHALIHALGAANAAILLAVSLASPLLSLVKPLSVPDGRVPFFWELSKSWPVLGSLLPAKLAGSGLVARADWFLLGYGLPLLASTGIAVVVLVVLARGRRGLGAETARLLHLHAVAFAVAAAPCVPILADDFFLPLGWGRMIVAGLNPYYVKLPLAFGAGTPYETVPWLDYFPYGPLWAAVSGAVAWLSGDSAPVGLVLFKAIIAGAWIACLGVVRAILADRPHAEQCVGMAVAGWVPLGATLIVADGHNDALVVLFVLLWVRGLQRGAGVAPALWLAAAVAVKYVAAPLFLLDVLHRLREREASLLRAVTPGLWASLPLLLLLGAFHLGRDLEAYLSVYPVFRYRFHTTEVALEALETITGLGLGPLPGLSRLVLPAIAVVLLLRYLRDPQARSFRLAALGVLCAVIFGLASYFWPWYLAWPLAIAALVPAAPLARWVVALALLGPFLVLPENLLLQAGRLWTLEAPALAWHAGSLALFVLLGRLLRGDDAPAA